MLYAVCSALFAVIYDISARDCTLPSLRLEALKPLESIAKAENWQTLLLKESN